MERKSSSSSVARNDQRNLFIPSRKDLNRQITTYLLLSRRHDLISLKCLLLIRGVGDLEHRDAVDTARHLDSM